MVYISSRGQSQPVRAAEAILKGIAPDGGLFVPEHIPVLNEDLFQVMGGWNYQQRAAFILKHYLPDFTPEEINACVEGAYNQNSFDDEKIAPLVKLDDNLYILELWHGPTLAFKDMALQILPRLLTTSARKLGDVNQYVILVATSGDTGKAALEGFRDVEGTRIIVFYPRQGVSQVQERQMVTQEGQNVYVAAVEGNFDDAQNGVKMIFADPVLKEYMARQNRKLSSANSINWGRLLPQVAYYISAYVELRQNRRIREGEKVNFVVPTGNFGNILAAYYAGRMGVPVNKLVCASNANNVLTEFINTGVYDRRRSFEKTISPSMDILISSNLERLLFELTGHDALRVTQWMKELQQMGSYRVDEETRQQVRDLFWADYSSDEETLASIKKTWDNDHYLLDTHTAVAMDVYNKYRLQTGDEHVTVVASTASPFKFGGSVAEAILPPEITRGKGEFEILRLLSMATGLQVPEGIKNLEGKPIRHNTVTSPAKMEDTVRLFLNS